MKHWIGLSVAIALGMLGALGNLMYLNQKAREQDKVAFVCLSRAVNRGEVFQKDMLAKAEIPEANVGNLREIALPYEELAAVLNHSAVRVYKKGELLLMQDLQAPPPALAPGENEVALWIPVETASFVPSLVVPGSQVSFIVNTQPAANFAAVPGAAQAVGPAAAPTASSDEADDSPGKKNDALAASGIEIIGRFKVISLGNRLGSTEVMQAAHIPQVQENVMGISVKLEADGQMERKAQKLWNLLVRTNFRQVGVVLHGKSAKDK